MLFSFTSACGNCLRYRSSGISVHFFPYPPSKLTNSSGLLPSTFAPSAGAGADFSTTGFAQDASAATTGAANATRRRVRRSTWPSVLMGRVLSRGWVGTWIRPRDRTAEGDSTCIDKVE